MLARSPGRLRVLDALIADFQEAFPSIQYRLVLEKQLVNAQANRFGDLRCVTIYGGLALHPCIGQSAITFTMLHETGHHMARRRLVRLNPWLVCECEADDWAVNEGASMLRDTAGRNLEVVEALVQLDCVVDNAQQWESNSQHGAWGTCWAAIWAERKFAIRARCRLGEGACCRL